MPPTSRVRELRAVPDFSDRGAFVAPPRRTVVIRGQVADRYSAPRRSSDSLGVTRPCGPVGLRPERAALWAVLLGIALVLAALLSAHM